MRGQCQYLAVAISRDQGLFVLGGARPRNSAHREDLITELAVNYVYCRRPDSVSVQILFSCEGIQFGVSAKIASHHTELCRHPTVPPQNSVLLLQ